MVDWVLPWGHLEVGLAPNLVVLQVGPDLLLD